MGFADDEGLGIPRRDDCYPVYLTKEGYAYFYKLKESFFEPYTGEVSENLATLRKFLLGETKINLRRIKEVFGANIAEDYDIKRIIERENLTDESTDTASVLRALLGRRLTFPIYDYLFSSYCVIIA
jgi:hypothetical protein